MRTVQQKYWDAFAVLSLFDAANKVRPIDGNLKIQKMGFLFEIKGQERGIKAGHYTFFRYNNGPFSKWLANDVADLKRMGFISGDSNKITRRGSFLLEFVRLNAQISGDAKEAVEIANQVGAEFGKYTGPALTTYVYRMTVPVIDYNNETKKVRDIEHCVDIIDPVKDKNLREIQLFTEDLIQDLKAEFSIPARKLRKDNPEIEAESRRRLEAALHRMA